MAAAQIGEVARPFLNFFTSASEVIIRLVQWMIWSVAVRLVGILIRGIPRTQKSLSKTLASEFSGKRVSLVFWRIEVQPLLQLKYQSFTGRN